MVVPVYNGEATIAETIRSVLDQTYRDFELLVINDGSTDATPEILAAIQDPRLKVLDFPNAGLSASRNRGIECAAGEFISFLDADDVWLPGKLEAQLKALVENAAAAVSYSWTEFVDMEGRRLGYGLQPTESGQVFADLLVNFFVGSGSNAMVRTEIFEELGRFDESLTAAEDWDMFLRIAARYPFVVVPETHVLYRITHNSMSRNVLRQEQQCLRVLDRAFSGEPGISLLHLKRHALANLYLYLATHALRGTPDRQSGLVAARFLGAALAQRPAVLKRFKQVAIVFLKSLSVLVLPSGLAASFRTAAKKAAAQFS